MNPEFVPVFAQPTYSLSDIERGILREAARERLCGGQHYELSELAVKSVFASMPWTEALSFLERMLLSDYDFHEHDVKEVFNECKKVFAFALASYESALGDPEFHLAVGRLVAAAYKKHKIAL